MSVALVAENKTKISCFVCTNFLLFCRHKQKIFSGGITSNAHLGFALDPLGVLQSPFRCPAVYKSPVHSSKHPLE